MHPARNVIALFSQGLVAQPPLDGVLTEICVYFVCLTGISSADTRQVIVGTADHLWIVERDKLSSVAGNIVGGLTTSATGITCCITYSPTLLQVVLYLAPDLFADLPGRFLHKLEPEEQV